MGRRQKMLEKEQSTLMFFLKALLGEEVMVELRNESQITGIIEHVDDSMNILMSSLKIIKPQGTPEVCQTLFMNGKNIRYIQIPDAIDVAKTLDAYGAVVTKSRERYSRSMRRPKPTITATQPSASSSAPTASVPAAT